MGALDILQGLVGGINQGLGTVVSQRQQALENDQKARVIAAQEQEQKRLMQAQRWEELKTKYLALNPQMDLTTEQAQPYVSEGFSFMKSPTGMLRRAATVQEQDELNKQDPVMVEKLARAGYAPKAEEGLADRTSAEHIQQLRNEQDQRGLSSAELIARLRAATDTYQANKMFDGKQAALEGQLNRIDTTAAMRPIDETDYNIWQYRFLRDPNMKRIYDQVTATQGANVADMYLRKKYIQARNPGLGQQ